MQRKPSKAFLIGRRSLVFLVISLSLTVISREVQWRASAASSNRRWISREKTERTMLMFGSMDDWILKQHQQQQRIRQRRTHGRPAVTLASSKTKGPGEYNPYQMEDDDLDMESSRWKEEEPQESELKKEATLSPQASSSTRQKDDQQQIKKSARVKMWPPWPFNLLQRSRESGGRKITRRGPLVQGGSYLWAFFGQGARVSFKEMQDIGSRFWFHLPPMTPPLILLAMIPRKEQQMALNAETRVETIATRTVIPLWSNPLARTLVLTGFSLAIMSWAHSELNRLRKLTPLPLNPAYRDMHKAILPHVLPDEVPEPFLINEEDDELVLTSATQREPSESSPTLDGATSSSLSAKGNSSSSLSKKLASSVPPRLQRHFKQLGNTQETSNSKAKRPFKSTWKNVRRMRDARKAEAQKVRRMAIYDELVALQTIKRQAQKQEKTRKSSKAKGGGRHSQEPLGYALVTGASRGIGRAIAVELARWEIPLILVARDLPRLTSLAYDLEACYGIKCCVLQADLNQPHAAEQIHEATRKAGLDVDILVNNAGISSTGLGVDMHLDEVDRMIRVNGLAVAELTHLYGKDMKERRRGRILMVSSVVGAVQAGPTVALYAATKAFEKMLGLSLAKELEPYGVGVTCLMPGAVHDTDFNRSSNTHDALCWKLPFYPKSPQTVAKLGVRALLKGDVEVTPGWQNRVFLKVLKPAMPQRLHNILVEVAWNPLQLPPFLKLWKSAEKRMGDRMKQLEERNKHHVEVDDTAPSHRKLSNQEWRPRSNSYLPPPLLLTVPGEAVSAASPSLSSPMPSSEPNEKPVKSSPVEPEVAKEEKGIVSIPEGTQGSNETFFESENIDTINALDGLQATGSPNPSVDDGETAMGVPTDSADQSTVESVGPVKEAQGLQHQQQMMQQPQKQQEADRHLIQLQEQVLTLQQQVQEQERRQLLRQLEQERRDRDLEFHRRELEAGKERQREETNTESPRDTGWLKRKPQTSAESKLQIQEVLPPKQTKKTQMVPGKNNESTGRDLMEESLDHPFFRQYTTHRSKLIKSESQRLRFPF